MELDRSFVNFFLLLRQAAIPKMESLASKNGVGRLVGDHIDGTHDENPGNSRKN